MRREDFTANAPGRLVTAPEGHLACVPNPLPPDLDLTPATINLLANAERAVGELNGIGRRGLPNSHLLINPFLRQEAVLSSRIEGTTANLQDLLLIQRLVDRGMLVEVTGRQLDRKFAARKIVEILDASGNEATPE
jgi:Fic family protein